MAHILYTKSYRPNELKLCWLVYLGIMMCATAAHARRAYHSERLDIRQLTAHTYIHISYLDTEQWGRVACNGLVYVHGAEAVVFDTPTDDVVSLELIHWIQASLHVRIVGIVVNHFHVDCLGGLRAFHQAGIASYASSMTIALAKQDTAIRLEIPQHGFEGQYLLAVGGDTVYNRYLGEAHTRDNITSYIPSERVLFGGCMVKAIGAGKGNLADANIAAWSSTIGRLKATYPNTKYVIPGHGKHGGMRLIDYTIQLFKP
jgi:metallo-beta-lactamase class B